VLAVARAVVVAVKLPSSNDDDDDDATVSGIRFVGTGSANK
jgi:hypothetical protein